MLAVLIGGLSMVSPFSIDTFFPAFDPSEWRVVAEEHHEADGENPYPYTFQILDRA